MKVLITGADGFIGKNLCLRFNEFEEVNVIKFTRSSSLNELDAQLDSIDLIFHLAGVNRPEDPSEFIEGNQTFTEKLCALLETKNKSISLILSSSAQAVLNNPYGKSKLAAEKAVLSYAEKTGAQCYIFRLPGVFGKWCKPNYNSVVATFCHNIANDLTISIDEPMHELTLVYLDDVMDSFLELVKKQTVCADHYMIVKPQYKITLEKLVELLQNFRDSRKSLITEAVGAGLTRALYSTFMTYYLPENFSYKVPVYDDKRGRFVEMLKTKDAGQFSYFTAPPGETRGEHYHHSKTEKFLVISGNARFKFRHMLTCEVVEIDVCGAEPEVVETIPGWVHNITNIGSAEIIVVLWANEIFNKIKPDTIWQKVEK
jgi:UDP-2-acetamido-2,6-beta-L-arabino-hexul-4-ose reductase